MHKALQVSRIKQEMIKHGWDPETVDVFSLVDGGLSYRENRQIVADTLKYKTRSESARQEVAKADHNFCEYLQENCEANLDKNACKAYVKEKCNKILGPLRAPKKYVPKPQKKSLTAVKKPKKTIKTPPVDGNKCEIGAFWVNGYTRHCNICKTDSGGRGRDVAVKGHCRQNHRVII